MFGKKRPQPTSDELIAAYESDGDEFEAVLRRVRPRDRSGIAALVALEAAIQASIAVQKARALAARYELTELRAKAWELPPPDALGLPPRAR